ncbi:MAG: UvrD-helicase domain-containing protein [Candidatus Paceibacterota bacterium]
MEEDINQKTPYLKGLNPSQLKAVLCTEGPLLIMAGAGAGKTKTVTLRILHLIKQGVNPENILAITFTNKAAKEMRERVGKLLKEEEKAYSHDQVMPFLSTFHSLGVYIIRQESASLGLPRFFSIFDKEDAKKAVKEAIEKLGMDPKHVNPGSVLSAISKEKGMGNSLDEFLAAEGKNYFEDKVAEVWPLYEKTLKAENALDFDDLLLKTMVLLKDPEIRKKYQNKWKYIHIDEYQDTNKVQYEIAKYLAGDAQNIAVVGDVDQSIYSWRGADFKNIMRFEKDYPETESVLLEENYRSTKNILAVANAIIQKNTMRKEKNLFTKNEDGDLISLYAGLDERDEATYIASHAKELIDNGHKADEIAVLYRANFQSRSIEEAFIKMGVSYNLIGTKFFERKEIKDALSYIKASLNPQSISDIKRIINTPARGIGKVTVLKILEGKEEELTGATQEKLKSFRNLLTDIKEKVESEKPSEVVKFVIARTGMEEMFKKGKEEDLERLENLRELVTFATSFDYDSDEAMMKFLEHASLFSDQDEMTEEKIGVKLMTVHAAKGLEFDTVFVTGLEDKLFPHQRIGEEESSLEQEEEERRLFYVALTRARRKIFLTYASVRTVYGSREIRMPSEFIMDIDDAMIKKENSFLHDVPKTSWFSQF